MFVRASVVANASRGRACAVPVRSFRTSSMVGTSTGSKSRADPREPDEQDTQGFLILEDGSCFRGRSFGAPRSVAGEAVFNTGMVGYTESLTDPSYRGQLLNFTYPLVGNYGVPSWERDQYGLPMHFEADRIHVAGMIVAEYSSTHSHWNAERSLGQWLRDEGIPALSGVDTRALTKKIREKGVMLGKIVISSDLPLDDPNQRNLVAEVSVKSPQTYGNGKYKIIAIDCGIKANIIRSLVQLGDTTVKVVPWDYDFTKEDYDGLFISNGPGDPGMVKETVGHIRKAFEIGKPVFGICLGNQLMALAAGAGTFKLKFGNRGQNQPCVDLITSRVYITPQNHGYAVDNQTLPMGWKPYFINVNDGTNEGLIHTSKPFMSVQFHPEARAGPQDTWFLFKKFYDNIQTEKARKTHASAYVNPKRVASKALILGSGALQIGQAGEFDYSGSQCIKALKEAGLQTVLINPNIATVQTSKDLADRTYLLPVTTEMVEKVIERERPDGILLGFGGQTGLNTGIELHEKGILARHKVRVLGTSVESIIAAEDRQIFCDKLNEIGERIAPSFSATTVEDALKAGERIGYPLMIRSAFSLGGLGSGFCASPKELEEMAQRALASSPQVLVEKSLKGWKEVEYEVVRDANDNCITVCNMENFDPMGIHTGESIVVAPSQTLSNDEYHMLRTAAIRTIKHLGIVGECNIQYALNPGSLEYCVIEVNPRLSRSSALASKATGYPLAFVAAKLALGISLPEVQNSVTKTTSACFEPSLDYIVTKVPRWDLKKFQRVNQRLGSSMKSVGEVMAIGRSFEESLQKALRMVDTSNVGFASRKKDYANLEEELHNPTPERVFALANAFDKGYTVDQLHDLTKIDRWFLDKLRNIKRVESDLKRQHGALSTLPFALLERAKMTGFSDDQVGRLTGSSEAEVRSHRKRLGILPKVKQIDTLAAEFPAKTNYLYMTYNAATSDLPEDKGGYMVLGSGTYRIGSSVEFDYCSVFTAKTLRKLGHKTIMLNYNPETVSTDYDESDKLYFEELSLERVLDVYDRENPQGVVISMGGQQPQNIAMALHANNVRIVGTSPTMIDAAEDRHKFSKLMDSIGVDQPEWKELRSTEEAVHFAQRVGFPVLVRPSYVLSGAAMKVAWSQEQLTEYLGHAAAVSPLHPVVVTKFIEGAREIECDAVANQGRLVNWAVSEHIENAGVHSGDATMVLPSDGVPPKLHSRIITITQKIAKALEISGPVNVQYLVRKDERSGSYDIKVIETNLRASRSFPFVSKTYNIDFIETATRVFLGENVTPNPLCDMPLKHVCVKFPMFSFQRLLGADPVLGVEMASTGEVACLGDNKYEAFLKAMYSIPAMRMANKTKTIALSGAVNEQFMPSAKALATSLGYNLVATPEVAVHLQKAGVPHRKLTHNELIEQTKTKQVELNINFPSRDESPEQYPVRRRSVDFAVPLITNPQVAMFWVEALQKAGPLQIKAWQDYFPEEGNGNSGNGNGNPGKK